MLNKIHMPDAAYFTRHDTLWLAKDLLGRELVTQFNGIITAGIIVETEAYLGITDRASHAFGGRHTGRTRVMYLEGGHAYVYLCYGMHHLFNVVTGPAGTPHAILIRAIEPTRGIAHMQERRKKTTAGFTLTSGPGSLSMALGIHKNHSGMPLQLGDIFITGKPNHDTPHPIAESPRIGVDYAGEDALLPYRFFLENNPWVSGKKIKTSGN